MYQVILAKSWIADRMDDVLEKVAKLFASVTSTGEANSVVIPFIELE